MDILITKGLVCILLKCKGCFGVETAIVVRAGNLYCLRQPDRKIEMKSTKVREHPCPILVILTPIVEISSKSVQ